MTKADGLYALSFPNLIPKPVDTLMAINNFISRNWYFIPLYQERSPYLLLKCEPHACQNIFHFFSDWLWKQKQSTENSDYVISKI